MITFLTHLKVPAHNAAAFEALLTKVRDATCSNEPGVAYYDFAKSADMPDTYVVVEVYRDAAAQASHMQCAWVKDSIPETLALIEGGFDIKQYVSPGQEPAVRQMKEV